MTDWKRGEGKYADKESKFGMNFREDHPDLFTKLGDGKYMQVGKSITEKMDGQLYQLTVKEITSKKDGKKYVLVERKLTSELGEDSEEQKATDQFFNSKPGGGGNFDEYAARQARIDKAHQENLEMQTRIAVACEAQANHLINISSAMAAIFQELRRIADAQEAKHEI